jgi:ABC-type branched-subunit amino acid transport system ATPase component
VNDLVTSVYIVPILSGLAAIQLAQEPDGLLSLAGQRGLEKRRRKQRELTIAAAEATMHDGMVPEHERVHAVSRVRDMSTGALSGSDSNDDVTFRLDGIVAGYGDVEVLHGADLRIARGEVVALLGANGAGKSTLCAVAAGVLAPTSGSVRLQSHDITAMAPFLRAREGMLLVPEARGIFPGLTVEENLAIALRSEELRAKAYARFPALATRRKQVAGVLSGGEQQMLSLAPALADPPTVLIADEPTLGLAPMMATMVTDAILELRDHGSAVLLVEEHAHNALKVADTLVVMELGSIVWRGPCADANQELLASAYLGTHASV